MKKINFASPWVIALIYAIFIIGAFVYFVGLQGFGFNGLQFSAQGRDQAFTPLDILIILTLILALSLMTISLLAFNRKKTTKLLIVSVVFFFFALKEFLDVMDNFFPSEKIYTLNAIAVLEVLILFSFVLIIYKLK